MSSQVPTINYVTNADLGDMYYFLDTIEMQQSDCYESLL